MAKTTRLRMPIAQRAKQFAPFKAVTGLDEALEKKRREMEYEEERELSKDRAEEINRILMRLPKGALIRTEYYDGTGYATLVDVYQRADPVKEILETQSARVPFSRIRDIEILEE
ncbi:MAG: hypothetical protein IJJ34_08545 [Clostridia bacterium]|nr:hypothetical protein [Clostridia bacterium]